MMNRAERRRTAKQVQRGEIVITDSPRTKLVPTELVSASGKRYTDINKFIDDQQDEIASQCGDIAAELLYKTEIYICVANILIMLYAVDNVVGDLKTVQKSYKKILGCFNKMSDYVDEKGIRAAYEEFHRKYGIELEFDDCDLNWLFDHGDEIRRRFKIKVGK